MNDVNLRLKVNSSAIIINHLLCIKSTQINSKLGLFWCMRAMISQSRRDQTKQQDMVF